jgi:hypothetical protein
MNTDQPDKFRGRLARAQMWFVNHIAFVVIGFAMAIRSLKASPIFIYGIVFFAFMSAMKDLRDVLAPTYRDDPDDH